jgi:predicted metal-dependent HD superfamily phosphohydrolase
MIGPDRLFSRWLDTWWAVTATDGNAVYQDLVARYAEPQRAYHTLEHIVECLGHFDAARHLAERPVEVEAAIWFHDAIYDPRSGDNEEQSALLAEQQMRTAGADDASVARIAALIRTTTHASTYFEGDAALLVDVDLAILGTKPERFERYDAAIRQEYAWVPDTVFRRERARVLAGFMARPRIYFTTFFNYQFEGQARANIMAALQRYQ